MSLLLFKNDRYQLLLSLIWSNASLPLIKQNNKRSTNGLAVRLFTFFIIINEKCINIDQTFCIQGCFRSVCYLSFYTFKRFNPVLTSPILSVEIDALYNKGTAKRSIPSRHELFKDCFLNFAQIIRNNLVYATHAL